MVFKNINLIQDKIEKSSFFEKVNLYIRIVESIAEINKIDLLSTNFNIEKNTVKSIIDLGIINEEKDLETLKKILSNSYKSFIQSVNFSFQFPELIGSQLDKLNNSVRAKLQEKNITSNKPKVADFFCGAGGLSCGFTQEGFQVVFANDHEDVCIETYSYNHPEVPNDRIINGDIRKIVDNIENFINEDVDVVVGGPPCQGFSSANQQRIIDDPRNELYKYFVKAIEKLSPKFVIMENVRGMLPYANQISEDYQNIISQKNDSKFTYNIAFKILVSDDFGVAQKRQRLIFIAVRDDIEKQFNITPFKIFENIVHENKNSKKSNLSDALNFIEPLEANRIKNTNETDSDVSGKKVAVNKYSGNENEYLRLINEGRLVSVIFNHKARYVSDLNYEIYKTMEQGDDATNEKIAHLMPYAHRNHVFKDKYYKLMADKPSRTITAHLRMDCHSHIHPFQTRSITPREAARIQSFPDDYVFLGAYLKTYMQIGNAVPPLMARAIAKELKKYLIK